MRDKSLLSAGQSGLSPLLTDKETLAAERKVLKFFRSGALAGRLDLEALSLEGRDPEKSLQRRLANTSLTDGQRDAVLTVERQPPWPVASTILAGGAERKTGMPVWRAVPPAA